MTNPSIQSIFKNLTELHVHVGSAVDPPIMWEIAHEQGIKLPTKDYWEFEKLITVTKDTDYQKYLDLFYWTELIQSSPEAIEKSIYSIASGAYRKNNITTLEIRFNPMKRNRGGERDLDHIILAAIHGMEKSMLSFPINVGLIFCLDRTFPLELNTIIAKKAIKYSGRGVVGIDVAGSITKGFKFEDLKGIVKECKKSKLGITIHTGEATGPDEVREVIETLKPDRIGHGVRSTEDTEVLKEISKRGIVLEVCPTSNVHTKVVDNIDSFRMIFEKLKSFNVSFTVNTDGPEMLRTNLLNEYNILVEKGILSVEDLQKATTTAKNSTFVKT